MYPNLKYNEISESYYIEYNDIEDKQDFLDSYMIYNEKLRNIYSHKARSIKRNNSQRSYDSVNILTADTENTTVKFSSGRSFAYSYAQMLNINGEITVLTRYIEDFGSLLNDIQRWYSKHGLTKNNKFKYIIWFHNLSYDFQFLLNITKISETLSRKKHDVIKAFDEDKNIEYRDSYSLLGVSLDSATKDYKVKHRKLKGNLNYSLVRNPSTTLDEKETAYCINDVQGLSEIIDILMNTIGYGKNNKGKFVGYKGFPNTKTGLVRNFMHDYIKDNKLNYKRNNLFKSLYIESNIYKYLKLAYQGGYTHAFYNNKREILNNIRSYDITSDYPYQMLTKKYPMTKFIKSTIKDFNSSLKKNMFEDFAFLITVKLIGVECKENLTIIPYEKFKKSVKNPIKDNGKIYSCDEIVITCTEQDFLSIMSSYKMKNLIFLDIYRSKKEYLPEWIIQSVFEFYEKKTTLKDVAGQEILYQYYKQLLNSIYGCCVQDPCKKQFCFTSGKWDSTALINDDEIEKAVNKATKKLVSYAWGVWVTAYARKTLIDVALKLDPEDIVYCDTDSIKFKDRPKYKGYFEEFNRNITENNKKVSKELGVPYSRFIPKNNKGKIKEIGLWDDEGLYLYFKSTGAKRYLTYKKIFDKEENKDKYKFEVTCCGIRKDKMKEHLLRQTNLTLDVYKYEPTKIEKIMNIFKDDFKVEAEYNENGESETGKMVHTYYSTENTDYVVKGKNIHDYKGGKETIICRNYITLEPAEFTLAENHDLTD